MTEDHRPSSPVRTILSVSRSGPRLFLVIAGTIGFWAMQLVYLFFFLVFGYLAIGVFWVDILHRPWFTGGH